MKAVAEEQHKAIAFVVGGSFSRVNDQLATHLSSVFPEYRIDRVDVKELFTPPLVVARQTVAMVRSGGVRVLVDKSARRRSFYRTRYGFEHIKRTMQARISPNTHVFSFQTQSLFDASVPGIPHYVYTDHTAKANDLYPEQKSRETFPREWLELEASIYEHARRVFTTSQFAARSLLEQYRVSYQKPLCVYSGINHSFPPGGAQPESSRRILFIGVDWERKGGPTLLAAFDKILGRFPDATLVIAGCSPREAVIHPCCEVHGQVSSNDIVQLYRSAAAFCLPSLMEPSAAVLAEAAANGLPIVATDLGGTPDRVIDGQTGYLVAPGEVDALAKGLERLMRSPENRVRMGQAGRRLAQARFSWVNVAARMRREIEESGGLSGSNGW